MTAEYTAHRDCFGPALCTIEAADALGVIWIFIRHDTMVAQAVTLPAVVALVRVEPHKENRDAVKQPKYRSQRTKDGAPWPVCKEDGEHKDYQDCALQDARPDNFLARNSEFDDIRHSAFKCASRAYPADIEEMVLAQKIRHSQNRSNQHHVSHVPRPLRQRESGRRHLRSEVLQETKRTGKAAEECSEKGPRDDQYCYCRKWKDMKCAKACDYADRTGEGGQWT